MIQKIKTFIWSHKFISLVIILVLFVGGYFIFKNKASGEVRYVTEMVQKGNIISTVAGTGQVEASSTVTLSPKASGDITNVLVGAGDYVYKGKLIASLDASDAKIALENAKISLAKLTKGPDTLTLLQKENAVTDSYNSGWNTVSSYVNDMTIMVSDLENIYSGTGYLGYKNTTNLSKSGKMKVSQGEDSYYQAQKSIDNLTKIYKTLSRSSSQNEIENLINNAYDSSKVISNAVKNTETAFNAVVNELEYEKNSDTATNRTNIASWLSSSNSYVNSLSQAVNNIKESKITLSDTVAGTDPLDIRSAQLSLQSKIDAYNNYFVYAPFDGVIATLTAKVGESSGSSIGTLITKQKLAVLSLNEVDIAKIKLGQKATLTFDAIDGLTISGKVAEIDSIGTVSQGVVSYNVKISFDVNDDRIKPGMSVSAEIITDTATDVLVVPSGAVKSKNGASYVETFNETLPEALAVSQGSLSPVLPNQIEVQIGLVGDTETEIISPLKEGDIIVTKTITSSTSTAKSTTPSILNAVGGNRAGSVPGSGTGRMLPH